MINIKIMLYLLSITALQFFIQGVWSMTLGLVLNNNAMGDSIRAVFFLLGVATIVSPLFIGYVSDKFSSPKIILSLLHFSNAINMIGLYLSFIHFEPVLIIAFIFVTGLLFYPTTALLSSLTFQNVTSDSIFPIIRSFGTVGFMLAGFFIGYYNIESSYVLFIFASAFSIIISIIIYRAPFKRNELKGDCSPSLIKSLKNAIFLVKEKKAFAYFLCALLMMISQLSYTAYMPVYLDEKGFDTPSMLMQVAVISELVFMLCLPIIIKRCTVESLMLVGTLTYALRSFIILKVHDTSFTLMIAALILHGFSWVMFFIVFDVFIKKISLDNNQHQMQSLKVIFINGLGVSMASLICGYVFNNLMNGRIGGGWSIFWSLPLLMSLISFVIIFFKRKRPVN